MDLRSGYPYWPVHDGLLATWPPLTTEAQAEVVILGGGISGALVADQLTAEGIQTLVLDAREIGWGATAGSTALLQYDLDRSLTELSALLGRETALHAYRACDAALDQLDGIITSLGTDVGYTARRVICLASRSGDASRLEREAALRNAHGLPAEFWSQALLRERTGIDRPAALTSTHAAQVDPYALTIALLQRAATRGARVFDRTQVTRIRRKGDRLILSTDRGARVTCRTLIRATGYETELLLRQKSVSLHSTYAFASEPIADLPPEFPQLWETARPYLYLRTTADRRLIVGGEDDPFSSEQKRDRALEGKVKTLLRKAKKLLPDIAIEPAYWWAGTFAESDDSMPYIGAHPKYPQQLFALCYGGNGITFATIAARQIRDRVLGRCHPDEILFRFGR